MSTNLQDKIKQAITDGICSYNIIYDIYPVHFGYYYSCGGVVKFDIYEVQGVNIVDIVNKIIISNNSELWDLVVESIHDMDYDNKFNTHTQLYREMPYRSYSSYPFGAISYYFLKDDLQQMMRAFARYCEILPNIKNLLYYPFILFFNVAISKNKIDIAKWALQILEQYAFPISFVANFKIDASNFDAFQWLLQLGETPGYKRVDIHYSKEFLLQYAIESHNKTLITKLIQLYHDPDYGTFTYNRKIFDALMDYNNMEVINSLLEIGRTESGGKIRIGEFEFIGVCAIGDVDMARWIIERAESINRPIDIHYNKDQAFRNSLNLESNKIPQFLIQLGESGYGVFDLSFIDDSYFNICSLSGLNFIRQLQLDDKYRSLNDSQMEKLNQILDQ